MLGFCALTSEAVGYSARDALLALRRDMANRTTGGAGRCSARHDRPAARPAEAGGASAAGKPAGRSAPLGERSGGRSRVISFVDEAGGARGDGPTTQIS